MKKTKYISILIAIILFSVSCKKDDLPVEPKKSEYYITVDIDGKTTSFNNSVQVDKDQSYFFTIRGEGNNGRMVLELDSLPVPIIGTFTSSEVDILYGNQSDKNWYSLWTFHDTITVLENNSTYVKGTFSFVGVATDNSVKLFTKGSFKAKKM